MQHLFAVLAGLPLAAAAGRLAGARYKPVDMAHKVCSA